ncbi:MAG: TSCPD domain-containing protein, partial [Actinomycetia bacterium]|nr:TSCPD domain-containing protein [Actinomycetes bacterium]
GFTADGAAGATNCAAANALTAEFSQAIQPSYNQIIPRPRPLVTSGFTERMKIGCGNLYVTVNFDENGICEVFTSTGKAGGCPSQSEASARLASIALRSGISVEEVCDQLKGIRCPSTIRQDNMSCTSCPDAIARVVTKVHHHLQQGGPLAASAIEPTPLLKRHNHQTVADLQPGGVEKEPEEPAPAQPITFTIESGRLESGRPISGQIQAFCPECGSQLEYEGGCAICRNCGYSKCQ